MISSCQPFAVSHVLIVDLSFVSVELLIDADLTLKAAGWLRGVLVVTYSALTISSKEPYGLFKGCSIEGAY